MTKIVYESEVEGRRDKREPCTKCLARGKKACNAWSLTLREAKVKCMDTEQWREFVNGINGGMSV